MGTGEGDQLTSFGSMCINIDVPPRRSGSAWVSAWQGTVVPSENTKLCVMNQPKHQLWFGWGAFGPLPLEHSQLLNHAVALGHPSCLAVWCDANKLHGLSGVIWRRITKNRLNETNSSVRSQILFCGQIWLIGGFISSRFDFNPLYYYCSVVYYVFVCKAQH
jgi:hypothetical protein